MRSPYHDSIVAMLRRSAILLLVALTAVAASPPTPETYTITPSWTSLSGPVQTSPVENVAKRQTTATLDLATTPFGADTSASTTPRLTSLQAVFTAVPIAKTIGLVMPDPSSEIYVGMPFDLHGWA